MSNITSFSNFYTCYLLEHRNSFNRLLHHIGTLLGVLFTIIALWIHLPILIIFGIIIAYSLAWLGHFKIEKNVPTTFRYPIYSFIADFLMLYHFFSFQIEFKVRDAIKKESDY